MLVIYLFVSLRHLDVVPRVYEDEPWQASTGWKIATQGVFGSDMFAGFYGMEQRYYGFLPVHPILLAIIFKIAGLGLYQARLESVAMGGLTLALVYALGRRLFGAVVGLLAVSLLLTARLNGVTPSQLSGILLLDIPRIVRYDIVVPAFGLASLYTLISAEGRDAAYLYALAGLLAALSSLSHAYGAFWMVALALISLWNRVRWVKILALAMGFLLPWSLYLVYVLGDLQNWRGQVYGYGPRFELLNPRWYLANLAAEYHRYGPGLGAPGWGYLLRPGFWLALVAIPCSTVALGWRAIVKGDRAARAILVPAVTFPLLFAFLITIKMSNYLVTVLPVFAIAAAWGGVALWRYTSSHLIGRWVRPLLVIMLLAVYIEGASRMALLERAASQTTPYPAFSERLRSGLGDARTVLGLHTYWFGLQDLDYRSWVVPIGLADQRSSPAPRFVYDNLSEINPDALLIDPAMRAYLDSPEEGDPIPVEIGRWIRDNGFRLESVLTDPTYGRMEVYRRTR